MQLKYQLILGKNIHKFKSMSIFLSSYSLGEKVFGVSLPGPRNNLFNMPLTKKIANKILSILRNDKKCQGCITVSNVALVQLHPKYHMQ